MGGPNLPPTPPTLPPPPDMADNILRQKDAQQRKKMQALMGLSKFFQPPKAGSASVPPPANLAPKTLLGQ